MPSTHTRIALGSIGVAFLVLSTAAAGGALVLCGVPVSGLQSTLIALVCVVVGLKNMVSFVFSEVLTFVLLEYYAFKYAEAGFETFLALLSWMLTKPSRSTANDTPHCSLRSDLFEVVEKYKSRKGQNERFLVWTGTALA